MAVEAALFFYNIGIMAAYVFCAAIFQLFYRRHKDKVFHYISLVFTLFVIDNLIYYMIEFLPSFAQFYESSLYLRTVSSNAMSYLVIYSYRLVLMAAFKEKIGRVEKGIWASVLVLQLMVPLVFMQMNVAPALSLIMHILAIGIFARGLHKLWSSKEGVKDAKVSLDHGLRFGEGVLIVSLVLQFFFAAENMLMLLMPTLRARSIGIELIGLFYTVLAIRYIVQELMRESSQTVRRSKVQSADDEGFHAFCNEYDLTKRERDVAFLLAEGFSNQQIAEKLYISEGTVKTHVHNIYKKIGVNTRLRFSAKLTEFLLMKK